MADAKGNAYENAILLLIFNATTFDGMAEDDTTSPVTDLSVALHTSSPGEAGDQTTNEISYTGYARVDVPRDNTGWTVTGNEVSPVNPIEFGIMTAGAGGTVTHFSVGTGVSDFLLYYGTVTPNITVVNGVVPRLSTDTVIREL
jgi:hypothetical protein